MVNPRVFTSAECPHATNIQTVWNPCQGRLRAGHVPEHLRSVHPPCVTTQREHCVWLLSSDPHLHDRRQQRPELPQLHILLLCSLQPLRRSLPGGLCRDVPLP